MLSASSKPGSNSLLEMGDHRRFGHEILTPEAPPGHTPNYKRSFHLPPGNGVLIGAVATILTFLSVLILYNRYTRIRRNAYLRNSFPPSLGLQKSVMESLPIFLYGIGAGALFQQNNGDDLDCSVCLFPYQSMEYLRILPKCKHVFHVTCIDAWLSARSTCPLCRSIVEPDDLLLIPDLNLDLNPNPNPEQTSPASLGGEDVVAEDVISPEILADSESQDDALFPPARIDQMDTTRNVIEGRKSFSSPSNRQRVVPIPRSQSEYMEKRGDDRDPQRIAEE